MIRVGQTVGCYWQRKLYICLVHKWTGKDDDHVQLVTEKCLLSGGPSRDDAQMLTYHTKLIQPDWVNRYGDVIVPKDVADAVGLQIMAFLQTKKGKAMLARPPREKPAPPDAGRGTPQRADIPTKLSRGFSSQLSKSFEARISDGGQRTWSLSCLKERNVVMHDVFVDRETHGYSYREIAGRRGVTENNARQLYLRAKIEMRDLAFVYPVQMRREKRLAEAA